MWHTAQCFNSDHAFQKAVSIYFHDVFLYTRRAECSFCFVTLLIDHKLVFLAKYATKNIILIPSGLVFACRFTQYQRMLGTLAQCEFSMGKTLMVYDMNLREMENYEKIYSNIGEVLFLLSGSISVYNIRFHLYPPPPPPHCRTKHHICTWEDCRMQKRYSEGKEDTKKSPRQRYFDMDCIFYFPFSITSLEYYKYIYMYVFFPEYDALAKVIQQHPDRHETLK